MSVEFVFFTLDNNNKEVYYYQVLDSFEDTSITNGYLIKKDSKLFEMIGKDALVDIGEDLYFGLGLINIYNINSSENGYYIKKTLDKIKESCVIDNMAFIKEEDFRNSTLYYVSAFNSKYKISNNIHFEIIQNKAMNMLDTSIETMKKEFKIVNENSVRYKIIEELYKDKLSEEEFEKKIDEMYFV